MSSFDPPEYVSAREAADMLGVSVNTLYVYVGRKGLRSQAIPGARERRYWRADIERLSRREPRVVKGDVKRESAITLITERGPFYRGRSAIELAETATAEETAALLWDVEAADVFTDQPPRTPPEFEQICTLLRDQGPVGRAAALFHLMEEADPRAHDLSPAGMARTGAAVMRTVAALMLRSGPPVTMSLHQQISNAFNLDADKADLVRRLLVLGADHGFEPGAYAVRAVASTGVSPWRTVGAGLSVLSGRRSGFGRFFTIRRFLQELQERDDPSGAIVRRLREGEGLPGFDSPLYPAGDPRAHALLNQCRLIFKGRREMNNLDSAISTVHDIKGVSPDYALVSQFAEMCLGLGASESTFLVARSSGWVAHTIEQYASGEAEHREGRYNGPLPA